MAMDTNWIKGMKIESMGETRGIQVNPDQPSSSWKAAVGDISAFNQKLFSGTEGIQNVDHTNTTSTGPWQQHITEGSEGKVSKALVDMTRWDDEVANNASVGSMQQVEIDFSSPELSALSKADKIKFLQSLGIDPSRSQRRCW